MLKEIYDKGIAYYENNELEKAIQCFELILKEEPENCDVLFQINLTHQKKGEFAQAMNALIRILEIEPKNEKAKTSYDMIYNIIDYRYMERINV